MKIGEKSNKRGKRDSGSNPPRDLMNNKQFKADGFFGWIVGIFVTAIVTFFASYATFQYQVGGMGQSIENIREDLSDIKENNRIIKQDYENKFNELRKNELNDYRELDDKIEGIGKSVSLINQKLGVLDDARIVKDNESSFQSLVYYESDRALKEPEWTSSKKVAVSGNGELLSAEELIDEYVLVSYIGENGEEVFFYGKYDNAYHWDGRCIINVYSRNQELVLITDSEYDSGILKHYYQVFPDKDINGVKCWFVSNRIPDGDENKGETYEYLRVNSRYKEFDFDSVSKENIISAMQFASGLNSRLVGYYLGKTSEGKFKDKDGVIIKYSADGTIRTYYHGNVLGGMEGMGWEIARREGTNDLYMYYEGSFSNGMATYNKGYSKKLNLSQNEIDSYTANEARQDLLIWWKPKETKR